MNTFKPFIKAASLSALISMPTSASVLPALSAKNVIIAAVTVAAAKTATDLICSYMNAPTRVVEMIQESGEQRKKTTSRYKNGRTKVRIESENNKAERSEYYRDSTLINFAIYTDSGELAVSGTNLFTASGEMSPADVTWYEAFKAKCEKQKARENALGSE